MYYVQLQNDKEEVLVEQFFSDIEEALQATSRVFNGVKNNKNTRVVLIRDDKNAIPPEELLNLRLGE